MRVRISGGLVTGAEGVSGLVEWGCSPAGSGGSKESLAAGGLIARSAAELSAQGGAPLMLSGIGWVAIRFQYRQYARDRSMQVQFGHGFQADHPAFEIIEAALLLLHLARLSLPHCFSSGSRW